MKNQSSTALDPVGLQKFPSMADACNFAGWVVAWNIYNMKHPETVKFLTKKRKA